MGEERLDPPMIPPPGGWTHEQCRPYTKQSSSLCDLSRRVSDRLLVLTGAAGVAEHEDGPHFMLTPGATIPFAQHDPRLVRYISLVLFCR